MKIEQLKRMPGHLIRRAQQISSAIFGEQMAEFELTSVQLIALVAVADFPGLDATRLAELIDFDKATIGGVVERLERKRLIERRRSEEDRRIKALAVTPAARALIAVSFGQLEEVQRRILAPLSKAEQVTFMRLIGKLVRASAAPHDRSGQD